MAQVSDVHTERPISDMEKRSQDVLHQLLERIEHLDRTNNLSTEDQRVHAAFGGYGDVYTAYLWIGSKKIKVALKQLRVHLHKDQGFAKFLAKEMRLWSQLHHPNILEFLGYMLEENGTPSLISEWMENGTALTFVKAHPETDILRLVLGIAQGLEYLHGQDVVHSDLKSDNVLISEAGVPLICDFGTSRVLAATQTLGGETTSGRLQGSMRWLAPELFEGQTAHTKETDVWAFGMAVYELLVKDKPYYHFRFDSQIMFAIIKGEKPQQPAGLEAASDAIRDLWHICNNCWKDDLKIRWSISDVMAFLISKADAHVSLPEENDAWVLPASFSTSRGQADSSSETLRQLYGTYDEALGKSLRDTPNAAIIRSILAIVYVTASTTPLPVKAITAFLRSDPQFSEENADSVRRVIRSLGDVLYEDGKNDGAVRASHPSFLDFLVTKMELEGWDSPSRIHKIMFKATLSLMLSKLKFNICVLEDASGMNKDVTGLDQRISRCIPPELGYSCQHWFTHLRASTLSASEAQGTVAQLLRDIKVFFWLEVLGITGGVERSIPVLQQCSVFFDRFANVLQASGDVLKFVSSYSQAMASVPHIYISALSWVPTKSYLRDVLRKSFEHHSLVADGLPANWDRSLWTKRFNETVGAVAYSPDGECIAACIGNDIYLLDAISGQAIGEPLKGHTDIVTSISFSPDGTRIASGSDDETIQTWDTRTGQQLWEPLRRHSKRVQSVAFSPDGIYIASGSYDQTVRIWNSRTGEAMGEPLRGHTRGVTSVVFSRDGSRIASGSVDQTVRIWDSRTGELVFEPLQGHTALVWSVAFSPDGRRLISGSSDATIRVWDLRTGESIGEPLRGHSSWVCSVAFSPDGSHIISGSYDNTIRMWDSRTGEAFGAPLVGHSACVKSVVFSPDGAHVLSGSADCTVRTWSIEASNAASEAQRGHTGAITSVAFSPDGTHIASGSKDQAIRIWNARTGQQVGEPLRGHSEEVQSIAFSPDGTRLASGSGDCTVRVWNLKTGQAICEPLQGHTRAVTSVAFSHDGSHIASGSGDETIRIWDSLTGDPVGEPLQGHADWVRSIAFAPDDDMRVISGSNDRTIRIWNLRTGECVGEPLRGHSSWVHSVAFCPDGTRIASGSDDNTIRVWDAKTGRAISELKGHTHAVTSIAFSPDSSRIVSGSWDSTIRIWDSKTGEAVGEPVRCHSADVTSVAFSPDGARIVSGSYDRNVFVTKLADPGRDDWNRMCRNMDVTDGWVKNDEGELLLWIPERYRHYYRHNIAVWIREGRLDNVQPVVDIGVLKRISGTGWPRVYREGDKELGFV